MTEEQKVVKKPKRPLPLSRQMVNKQTAGVYEAAWAAHEKGEPVGWSTAIFPQEICETFDIPVLYPENNDAGISARHFGDRFIEHAEGDLKYPINICSYARLNLGLADMIKKGQYGKDDTAQPAMPRPTFLLTANNSCTQLMKWYECLSRTFNIPMFFVDTLYNYNEEPPLPHKIKYVRSQIENNIKMMEEFFHKKFDWDRYREVQRISQVNRMLFNEIVALNAHKPSPLDGFDLFNYMSCMVICRGKESTTEIFKQLKKEVEEHIKNGTSSYRGVEKYRVHWEGIACWPNLGFNLKTLTKYGVNAVMNGYVTAWDVAYEPGDMDGMAKAYQCSSTNSFTTNTIMDMRSKSMKKYGCDGMLCHVNRSCKLMTFHIFTGRDMIEEKNGIPVTNFDGDQSDTRIFSEAQYENRLQGLVEVMQQNKEGK